MTDPAPAPDDRPVPVGPSTRPAPAHRPDRRIPRPTDPALQRRPPTRSWWHYLGAALTVVLCVAGATLVGVVVVVWIALSSYGSNK